MSGPGLNTLISYVCFGGCKSKLKVSGGQVSLTCKVVNCVLMSYMISLGTHASMVCLLGILFCLNFLPAGAQALCTQDQCSATEAVPKAPLSGSLGKLVANVLHFQPLSLLRHSLCSNIGQASCNLPSSASCGLGLQACATTPGSLFL